MASQITTTLSNIASSLKALGIFTGGVFTHEPKKPTDKLTAALFLASIRPLGSASGLRAAAGLYVFTLRLYTDMLAEPVARIDPALTETVDKVMDAFAGDFDFGETVRNLDVFGEFGQGLQAEAGYIEVAGKMERIVDVTIPLVVNDVWSFG